MSEFEFISVFVSIFWLLLGSVFRPVRAL
jgi:hypothetical protein